MLLYRKQIVNQQCMQDGRYEFRKTIFIDLATIISQFDSAIHFMDTVYNFHKQCMDERKFWIAVI